MCEDIFLYIFSAHNVMRMRNLIGKSLSALLLASCGAAPEPAPPAAPPVPLCEQTFYISYNLDSSRAKPVGLGDIALNSPDIDRDPWTHAPRELPEGFEYVGDAKGGTGNTLQIVGCSNSVFMLWAYDALTTISSRNPKIVTDDGIKIGDPFEVFHNLYPNAKKREVVGDLPLNVWTYGYIKVGADSENRITGIEVTDVHFDEQPDGKVLPVGPRDDFFKWY